MKKSTSFFLLAWICFLGIFPSCSPALNEKTGKADTADTEPNRLLPKKLRGIPYAIFGDHEPNPVYAVFEDGMYVWKHNTSVMTNRNGLRIVEFGSFVWTDNDWYQRVAFTATDFAQMYNCPDAALQAGVIYTDSRSWRKQETLNGGDALWYYIAADTTGKKWKGTLLIETEGELDSGSVASGRYGWQPDAAALQWTGYAETGDYSLTGTAGISGGWIGITADSVTGGELVINMNSISHENSTLEEHLKNEDFFNVKKYPLAHFVLNSGSAIRNDSCTLTGKLTLCGITQPLVLPAAVKKENNRYVLTTVATIDRTLFSVRYGSSLFFGNLGDQAISNKMKLAARLVATRE